MTFPHQATELKQINSSVYVLSDFETIYLEFQFILIPTFPVHGLFVFKSYYPVWMYIYNL